MLRTTHVRLILMLTGGLGLSVAGCSSSLLNTALLKPTSFKSAIMDGHGTEQRVITNFTEALAEDNEKAFRQIVSTRFEQKAMRAPDAFKDLEILNLPKTKLEVVESKDVGDRRFETVAKEDAKDATKYQFIIVRDSEKNRWVVDDVMLRQQKRGTRATKSSVEVMDLLLTVREFLDVWQSADRNSVLRAVSSELREPLEKLPEPWLQRIIAAVSSEYESGMARRPEAQMNESDAVVKMPSKNGFLLLKVAREEEQWLVSDIEIRKRKVTDHPGSTLRQARALNAVTGFLAAYHNQDQATLEKLTESKFYQSSLRVGDLSMIVLPAADHAPEDFEIQSFAGQLTIMIPDQADVVRLDLTTPELANTKDARKPVKAEIETEFLIADVTIYDRQTQQQRNLKSAFTAPARAMLFLSALETNDLPVLKQISCKALAEETWNRIDPSLVAFLPSASVPSGEMTLQKSQVRGEVTELEFLSSGGQICSVIMRDENGSLKVEDVQYPDTSAQVASLRTQLMLAVPLVELASAWRRGDLELVKRSSSSDFNRLVWSNLAALPSEFDRLPNFLMMPVQKTQINSQRAMVELAAPGQPSVSVVLLKENNAWVVDEISMPQADGTRFEIRKALRQEIAKQFLIDPTGGIQQADYESTSSDSDAGVVQANGSVPARPRGNLTLPSRGKTAAKTAARSPGIDMMQPATQPDASKSSAHAEPGTLRFGPAATSDSGASTAASVSVDASDAPPRIRPRAAAETEEHNGVVYFKGSTGSLPKLPENAAADEDDARITDPSQRPIDIPME